METQKWLNMLEEKIKEWELPKKEEIEETEKLIASLERLEELLAQVESTLKLKSALNEKMENLVVQIDRLALSREGKQSLKKASALPLEETLTKIISRTKLASRVLDALASGLQMSLESAGKLRVKEEEEEGRDAEQKEEQGDKRGIKEQVDLQAILQPLGTVVQNVVEEKLKKIRAEEKRKEV
ncbi:MAG: hypothetical protein AB1523_05570 [Bacillota bacterium]